jgi:hypothetical protein
VLHPLGGGSGGSGGGRVGERGELGEDEDGAAGASKDGAVARPGGSERGQKAVGASEGVADGERFGRVRGGCGGEGEGGIGEGRWVRLRLDRGGSEDGAVVGRKGEERGRERAVRWPAGLGVAWICRGATSRERRIRARPRLSQAREEEGEDEHRDEATHRRRARDYTARPSPPPVLL